MAAAAATLLALLLAFVGSPESALRIFRLPQDVALGIPAGWRVADEESARAYEGARRTLLERKGLSGAAGFVAFQASSESHRASGSVMVTFLPPEASQEEVAVWSATQIEKLGRMLGEATRTGLVAAGAQNLAVGGAEKAAAGEKTALRLSIEFSLPDGRQYEGLKYFIYTSSRTVILTLQWTKDPQGISKRDRDRILGSLKVE